MTGSGKTATKGEKKKSAKQAGFFITFEGGEGAGKSTQIKLLADHLRGQGFEVIVTREPGGTAGAEAIRHVVLSGSVKKHGATMEALLFAAARIDHVEGLIAPALEAGKIVLCDRFIDSTRVYQGATGNLPQEFVSVLEQAAVDTYMPDLTFLLDLPAQEGMKRANARRAPSETVDRFEQDDMTTQEKRRQAFLKIARDEPSRCAIIDATQPVAVIAAEIAQISDDRLQEQAA